MMKDGKPPVRSFFSNLLKFLRYINKNMAIYCIQLTDFNKDNRNERTGGYIQALR